MLFYNKLIYAELLQLFKNTAYSTDGDIAECGVFRAGGTILLAQILKTMKSEKHIYGFDSFEGMPEPSNHDRMKDGKISYNKGVLSGTSIKYVQEKARFFKVEKYITFKKGFFEDTLQKTFPSDHKFCFVIIDPDQYSGTKYCLEYFYDKVVVGGIIVIDDYYLSDEEKLVPFQIN